MSYEMRLDLNVYLSTLLGITKTIGSIDHDTCFGNEITRITFYDSKDFQMFLDSVDNGVIIDENTMSVKYLITDYSSFHQTVDLSGWYF